MSGLHWLVVIHGSATLFMTGLVWFVQTVHYPLFARVARRSFADYEREHQRLTTRVVAPAMLVEAAAAVLLVFAGAPVVPGWMSLLGAALLAAIWLSTGLLVVPVHGRLSRGFDAMAHRLLVQRHRVRTWLWTARAILAVAMIQLALDSALGTSGAAPAWVVLADAY